MRWLALLLGACQFAPGALPTSTSDANDANDASDAMVSIDTGMNAPDAAPDTPPLPVARVRLLDIDDVRVTGGPHVDFPLLVSIASQMWLRDTVNGGDVARSDGFDIYFSSDQGGVTRLAHEVELYLPAAGTLVAWVKVPSLAPQSTLYLHYGDTTISTSQQNVTATWSGGYELVLHLDAIADATGKTTSFSPVNLVATDGQVDRAQTFNGTDSRVNLGSVTAVDEIFTAGGTAESWFYATGRGESSYGRLFDKGHQNGWSLLLNDIEVNDSFSFMHGTAGGGWGFWNAPAGAVTLDAWHHVAVTYDKSSSANDPVFYLDGVSLAVDRDDSPSGTMISDAAVDLLVGNRPSLDRTWDGQLDEMRLSSSPRSAGWIATQYRNQSDPVGFFTISAPL